MKSPHRLLAAWLRTVTVKKPGTLASKIGDSKCAVIQLQVKGTLDAADVRLPDMYGQIPALSDLGLPVLRSYTTATWTTSLPEPSFLVRSGVLGDIMEISLQISR